MKSFSEYVVESLIAERDYEILAYFVVSTVESLARLLKRVFPRDEADTLKEFAVQLKRAAAEKLLLVSICPHSLSRDVEGLDAEYLCRSCGRTFRGGWRSERIAEIAAAIYSLLRLKGLNGREARDHVRDMFGIEIKGAERLHSEIDALNLVCSTFLVLYDDPLVRSRFVAERGITGRGRAREIRRDPRLDDEDIIILNALKGEKGLSYADISRKTGLSYGRVKKRVRWLQRFGLVEVRKQGNRCLVFLRYL